MAFADTVLKKNVMLSVINVRLKNDQLKLKPAEFDHFEADTILSSKHKGQAITTFVERKSRLTVIKHLQGCDETSNLKIS